VATSFEEENPPAFLDYAGRWENNMNFNLSQIAGVLQAVSMMTALLAQLVHTVGNVNHPVILDKVNSTLQEVSGVVSELAAKGSGETTTPPAK
jgi:hypothetical protein